MPHGGIHGPGGGPRPLASCEQQIVFELEGRGDRSNIDEQSIEDELDGQLNTDVSVSTRSGRFDSPAELVVILGTDIVLEETFNDAERIVNSELFSQEADYTVSEWRIEGT